MVSIRGGKKKAEQSDKGRSLVTRPTGLDKMKAFREECKQQAQENPGHDPEVEERIYTGQNDCLPDDLALSTISPDPTNSRRFPVIRPEGEAEFLRLHEGESPAYVILDKGKLENKTEPEHPLYKHIEKQIDEIVSLAKQIKAGGGVYQAIEVFRAGGMDYRIVFGHRRFYAVVYLMGWEGVWSFRVHRSRPKTPKVRQFVENNSRSDLALYEKLIAFQSALDEINEQYPGYGHNEIVEHLGVSRATYYKYKKWISSEVITAALEDGIDFLRERAIQDAIKKAEIRMNESEFSDFDEAIKPELASHFIQADRVVPEYLSTELRPIDVEKSDKMEVEPTKKKSSKGRPTVSYKTPTTASTNVIRNLLTQDVTKMTLDGVDWNDVDWDDKVDVNARLKATIKALEKLQL